MFLTIHQANFFPYPGFFHKLSLADTFVILDDVQFQFDITNRNKIISTDTGWKRISIPVKKEYKFSKIRDVKINNEFSWGEQNYNDILNSYNDTKFFHIYKDYFKELFNKKWDSLFELNLASLKKTLEFLNLKIELIFESELNVSGTSTTRLVNICKKIGADTYISGPGGRNYLDEMAFKKNNINLKYQKYSSIIYQQNKTIQFIPDLSIIDLLSNVGSDSLNLIKEQNI